MSCKPLARLLVMQTLTQDKVVYSSSNASAEGKMTCEERGRILLDEQQRCKHDFSLCGEGGHAHTHLVYLRSEEVGLLKAWNE